MNDALSPWTICSSKAVGPSPGLGPCALTHGVSSESLHRVASHRSDVTPSTEAGGIHEYRGRTECSCDVVYSRIQLAQSREIFYRKCNTATSTRVKNHKSRQKYILERLIVYHKNQEETLFGPYARVLFTAE